MKYKKLGRSGLQVSELCLGTMTFGEEMGIGAAETECRAIFDAFLSAGGNFIDTANVYNRGTSERMLGRFIGTERDRLVIATKFSLNTRTDDPNAGGNHRKNLAQALEASLRRLGTGYVDLFWVHGWDASTRLDELMRALDDQVRAGKVLHIGVSNAPAWVVASANTLAAERGWTPFTAVQLHYNLVERSIEREFFQLAAAQDMAITPWSPLAGGLLTGKFDAAAPASGREGARLGQGPRAARVLNDRSRAVAEALSTMAVETGCRPAQLALAWLCQRSTVTVVPIIGARSLRQFEENIGSLGLQLTAAQLARIDGLSAPVPEYPQALLGSEFFQRLMHGEVVDRMQPGRIS
ncbi:MAG: aldo/keto reductase [Gammaproteobacteria bacterium]|nr:MAG: aldo/keto reductase [Gammaproteobacteria bacterium]